jgi:hypothetical protein
MPDEDQIRPYSGRRDRGVIHHMRFTIYEPDDDGSENWLETGTAANIEAAKRFTSKIKNVIVRDNASDSFVIVKKEN